MSMTKETSKQLPCFYEGIKWKFVKKANMFARIECKDGVQKITWHLEKGPDKFRANLR